MINLCEKPFLRTRANEELLIPSALPALVHELGLQVKGGEAQIQVAAVDALYAISTGACKYLQYYDAPH